jgi:hypothetical protein
MDSDRDILLNSAQESIPSLGEREDAPRPACLIGAAASFAASMARFAASGFITVDEPLHELRMNHCQACEYRRESKCSLCRCFVSKKAWLPYEDCPVGRWEC